MDEQAFRDRARDLALDQLATLFAEFQGRLGSGLCFEHGAVDTLRRHLAATLASFINQTPVEPRDFGVLGRKLDGSSMEHWLPNRKLQVGSERKFLEEAGLAAPRGN
jgi:hypothetical protein